jgi:hypothetical protein
LDVQKLTNGWARALNNRQISLTIQINILGLTLERLPESVHCNLLAGQRQSTAPEPEMKMGALTTKWMRTPNRSNRRQLIRRLMHEPMTSPAPRDDVLQHLKIAIGVAKDDRRPMNRLSLADRANLSVAVL